MSRVRLKVTLRQWNAKGVSAHFSSMSMKSRSAGLKPWRASINTHIRFNDLRLVKNLHI